jgi:hypothetical protein
MFMKRRHTGTANASQEGLRCSFCNKDQHDVRKLIAGPTVFICDECIAWIQKWYASQCDDDWEHEYGFAIGTLDNPGWSVKIDLEGTDLTNQAFEAINRLEPERAWLSCKVAENCFEGAGGPHMLGEILGTFVRWARTHT